MNTARKVMMVFVMAAGSALRSHGLRIALLYDNGEKELGGEVSYIHTIGEVQQAQTANEQWTPDLFAAVSREHSQRIVSGLMFCIASSKQRQIELPSPVFSAINNRAVVGTPRDRSAR